MSGRAFWIVALGAALAGLIAYNVFHRREQAIAPAEHAHETSGEPASAHEHLATQPAAGEVGAPSSPDARAVTSGDDGRDTAAEGQPAAIPGSSAPHASISQVLRDAGREAFVND